MNFMKKSVSWAFALITAIFTFVPEAFFDNYEWISQRWLEQCKWLSNLNAQDVNIIITRVICFMLVWIVTSLGYVIFLKFHWYTTIKGDNYSIKIEYGNILKKRNCKKVIAFDECFTTSVGNGIADINPKSICGQYLAFHPKLNMQQLISASNIIPANTKSKYENKERYESGTLVQNGDYLLLAFAKLDEKGKGRFFSRDEYLDCLDLLWKELENYYSEKDVCISILGSGTTCFDGGSGASISQQDLLDIMIWSYKLSSHKIKSPNKLRIVCRKNDGFSINNIDK